MKSFMQEAGTRKPGRVRDLVIRDRKGRIETILPQDCGVPMKAIRSGKNKGTMRSNVQATDIEFKFKSRVGVSSIYHKWA